MLVFFILYFISNSCGIALVIMGQGAHWQTLLNTIFLTQSTMVFDIVTIGSATVDVFVDTNVGELHSKGRTVVQYPVGAKLLIHHLDFLTGGGGTNTAVGFARLGLRTAYVGGIGKDSNGEMILRELKAENIKFLGATVKDSTGYSVILDSKEHHRTILTYKGANNTLPSCAVNTRWLYVSSLLNRSFLVQLQIVKKSNAKVAYNPSEYQIRSEPKSVQTMLRYVDVLIFNYEEAMLVAKKKTYPALFRILHRMGPCVIVITDGEKGAICSDGTKQFFIVPHRVKMKEQTGAGDAFACGFVAGLAKKLPIEDCLRVGATNAESVVQHVGAKNILLSWKEAMRRIKRHPHQVRIIEF